VEHDLLQGTPAGLRSPPSIAVAIPIYNEADGLRELLERVLGMLDTQAGGPHQLVLVDDGSMDNSLALLADAAAGDDRLVVVALARNFGHQAALTAALQFVDRDVTIVMDADLQDPPEAVPLFVEEYRRGYDVVYAQRMQRKEGILLRASYFLFYRLIARLADVGLPLDAGDFGLMSRRVVALLNKAPEHHRYLRGLRAWVGYRQTGIPIDRHMRHAGRSKYSAWKLLRLASDGIFAFSAAPLRAAALVGAFAVGLALMFAVFSVYAKLVLHQSPKGFTAIIVALTFLSGIQLLFLGVIGEYLGRVYEEVKGRPLFVVDRVIRSSRTA
jgi:polyisoprenyl-phosphate glycosyltransferase